MNFKLYITNKFAWKMDNKLVDILIENQIKGSGDFIYVCMKNI